MKKPADTPRQRSAAPSEATTPAAAVDHTLDAHRETLRALFPVPPARAARKHAVRRTAGGALVLVLAAGLWWADPAYRSQHFATAIGEQDEITLADGSRLVLDTDSAVHVRWHLRSRRLELQHGRVHFDIQPSALRPLTVAAGEARVRVVGTRFDVWREADATRVAVQHGQVRAWHTAAPQSGTALSPNQQVRLADHAHAAPLQAEAFDSAAGSAWQDSLLIFQDTPLADAIAEIQRYRATPIRLHGAFERSTHLSGVFDSRNTDLLLARLPTILPVDVVRHDDGTVDIRPR